MSEIFPKRIFLRHMWRIAYGVAGSLAFVLFGSPGAAQAQARPAFLHVSYDATREMLHEYNVFYAKNYEAMHGVRPKIRMSHGSSGKQARGVMDGLRADLISLALAYDVDAIANRGLLAKDWRNALPYAASPFYSTIVLLVRKGNPKNIQDWADLARNDVAVLTPNPKTSGGARWGYLAAWAYAQDAFKEEKKRKTFMCRLVGNVPFWDTAARPATTSFIRRKKGDVLVTWENEAYVAKKYFGEDAFEIITPSITMKAEPKLAIMNYVQKDEKKYALVKDYVDGLYGEHAQRMAARHFFRPATSMAEDAQVKAILPAIDPKTTTLKTIEDLGGFHAQHALHFAEGALFDQCTTENYEATQNAKGDE